MYYPGLSCTGTPTGNRSIVTKIQALDDVARNEIAIGQRISRAEKFALFFLPVIKSCPLKMSEKSTLLQSCDVLQDVASKYVAMDIPFIAEIALWQTLAHIDAKRKILTLIDTYTYLLHALQKLNELDIVQYDLKFGNVLFRQLTSEPRIADFGIAAYNVAQFESSRFPVQKGSEVLWNGSQGVVVRASKGKCDVVFQKGKREDNISRAELKAIVPAAALKKVFYAFTVEYSVWCIDVIILSYLADGPENKFDEVAAEEIGSVFIETALLYKVLRPESVRSAQKELRQQLSEYAAMDRTALIDFLISHSGTWDNYSLSIMYMEVDPLMFQSAGQSCSFMGDWGALLEQNVSANPKNRHLAAETLTLFDDIFLCTTAFAPQEKLACSGTSSKPCAHVSK